MLNTERLRLRIPDESDLTHVFEATRKPGFNDGMLWDPPATIEELREPLERSRRSWQNAESYHFTIERGGEFVGRISLRPGEGEGVLDTGYWTHPKAQGQGFMKEALRALVDLAFAKMGAQAVTACYATWNEPSRRVLEAVSFRTVAIVPGAFVKGDRISDEAHARLERQTWERICSAR